MNDKLQSLSWIMVLQFRIGVEQNRKYSNYAKLRKLKLLLFKKIHLTNGDGAGSGDLLRFSKKYQCIIWSTQWGIAQNATSMRRKTLNQPLIHIPHGMIPKRSCFNTENHALSRWQMTGKCPCMQMKRNCRNCNKLTKWHRCEDG